MKNKWFKRFGIFIGVVFLLILIANFGINFWLKHNLPNYLKKNTSYIVKYAGLDVDLGTGKIFATGISVNNKNPNDPSVMRIQGSIDTLNISRIGIFNALFRKQISTDNILLANPNLKIILPNKKKEKSEKDPNPFSAENIKIRNGNISILKPTQETLFSVKKFFLDVEGLELSEKTLEESIPVVFDRYNIKGEDFFFLPDQAYAISAKSIVTEDFQMRIKDFVLRPKLSREQFEKAFPDQRNIFDFKVAEMAFKDIVMTKKKMTLSDVVFNQADLTIYTTNAKPKKSDKTVDIEINLDEVISKNAKIRMLKPNGQDFVSTEGFDLNVNKIIFNEETAREPIPFRYEKFSLKGQKAQLNTDVQHVAVQAYALNDKSGDFRNIALKSLSKTSGKTTADLNINHINFIINEWKFVDKKLKAEVRNVLIDQLNGRISAVKNPKQTKDNANFDGLAYPFTIKNVELRNSNLVFDQGNQPLALNHLQARFQNLEINENTIKKGIPFKTGSYSMSTQNFKYKTKFYNLSASSLNLNNSLLELNQFAVTPLYSRSQYVRMLPIEKDLYTIKTSKIKMQGKWDLVSSEQFIDASQLSIEGLNANIFRSKVPADDNSVKPLYSEQLRKIKFPLYIANLDIKNGLLEYEEDTPKSDGPGKLTFNNFSLNAKNLNSGKTKGKPTAIPITVNCSFFNASPMTVKWNLNTANPNDDFSIAGNFTNLPASRVNQFVEPYLKIRTSGIIKEMRFDFKGNKRGIGGTMNMKHQDFKVSILKQDGEKNKILSGIANVFVKSNSGDYPESVVVEGVVRDPSKSFFNLFWKGIEEGLAKSLTGKSIVKTKATVQEVKAKTQDVKAAVHDASEKAAQKTNDVTTVQPEAKKEGIFKKLFKKKEKAEE